MVAQLRQCSSSVLVFQEELQIIVSSMDNIVRATSSNLRHVLGCQRVCSLLFQYVLLSPHSLSLKGLYINSGSTRFGITRFSPGFTK